MIAEARERLAQWIGGKRAAPIKLTTEYTGNVYGGGIASSQPDSQALLSANLGVPDMATRAIANRIGALNPLVKVSIRDSRGTLRDEILDDHVLKALLDKPHPDFTWQQLARVTAQWIVTVGDGYWLKIGSGLGVPAYLQPIPPHRVSPIVRDSITERYEILDALGKTYTYPAREIIRFYWPDPETLYTGEGYLGPNAVVADTARFAGEHLRNRYQFDATPPMVLKGTADAVPPTDPQWERWLRDFARKHRSRDGSHVGLPAMTPPGWEPIFAAMQSGADITPLLEHLQSNQLMNFGVPQSVLGRVISGDRSSAETNQYVFDLHTVEPIARMIAQALTYQLANDYDDEIFVEFEEFVASDKDYELRREAQDLALKVKSAQQVLEARGDDPEDASWGEFPVGTLADQPYTGEVFEDGPPMPSDDPEALGDVGDDLADPGDEPDENEGPRVLGGGPTTYRRKIVDPTRSSKARSDYFSPENEWGRVKRRESDYRPKFTRALSAIFDAQKRETIRRYRAMTADRARIDFDFDGLFDPTDWEKAFSTKVEPIRRAAFLNSAEQALTGLGIGKDFELTDHVLAYLKKEGAELVDNVGRTTKYKLRKTLLAAAEAGEGPKVVERRIAATFRIRRQQAATIARTELHKATQTAQIESFRQSGVVQYKRWHDFGDTNVRKSHIAEGISVVKLGEKFRLNSGNLADHPGDPSLPPSDLINCRCFVTPEFDDPDEVNP